MREYEVTVVLKPDLDEETQTSVLERLNGWLAQADDEDSKPKIDYWGLRTLAYPIKNYNEGYYVYYEANLEPRSISEIERNMLYMDEVLRHLFVRKGG